LGLGARRSRPSLDIGVDGQQVGPVEIAAQNVHIHVYSRGPHALDDGLTLPQEFRRIAEAAFQEGDERVLVAFRRPPVVLDDIELEKIDDLSPHEIAVSIPPFLGRPPQLQDRKPFLPDESPVLDGLAGFGKDRGHTKPQIAAGGVGSGEVDRVPGPSR
jgi:hypothetical protein